MSRRILSRTGVIFNGISRAMCYIALGILAAMMLLTVADVFLRYVFNRPILGTTEITQLMMVTLGFFLVVWCTAKKAHLKIDILNRYIPTNVQAGSDIVYSFLALGLFSFICWQSFREAGAQHLEGRLSEILDIPIYPFYLIVAAACAMVVLLLLVNVLQVIFQRNENEH